MKEYKEVDGIDTETYAGKAALACRKKARGIIGDELINFHLVDFVTFMLLNNKFNSKGIYITEENREEAYIQIIETGDDSLIADLEKYLFIMDDIKNIESMKDDYAKVIKQLKMLSDQNDQVAVNAIIKDYLRK